MLDEAFEVYKRHVGSYKNVLEGLFGETEPTTSNEDSSSIKNYIDEIRNLHKLHRNCKRHFSAVEDIKNEGIHCD